VILSLLLSSIPLFAPRVPCAPSDPPPAAPLQAPRGDPTVEELARWTARFTPQNAVISSADFSKLEALVADARMLQVSSPERRHEVVLALLDLAALQPPDAPPPDPSLMMFGPPQRERASQLGVDALHRALDTDRSGELCEWIASGILAQPKLHSSARLRALLHVLRKRYEPATLLAVMNLATCDDRTLRDDSMAALVGWKDDGVHRFLLQQLEKYRADPKWINPGAVLAHFAGVKLAPASDVAATARDCALRGLAGSNWRDAVRSLKLTASIDDQLAVPMLLACWTQWIARRETGHGSRRVEGQIWTALKQRTGASIGESPERWATWWKTAQAGQGGASQEPEAGTVTRAAFFGLHPLTDRVVFVIDRSGSMSSSIGTVAGGTAAGGKAVEVTRYREALRQMLAFLAALGPSTKFRIVLFESSLHVWNEKLQPATKANLDSAERWCAKQQPEGGTMLRSAIEDVLRIGPDDSLDLARIEEDTVIVLCDGETTEGPQWVEPLLARINGDACMEFDCVQIGSAGDGTLQKLAALSGGQCVRVD
jgi:hypothetical protein